MSKYKNSIKDLISRIYDRQKRSVKQRKAKLPTYSKEELSAWILNNDSFYELYSIWVESNYNKKLTPSIDRKDNSISYTLDNIQILTWDGNNKKGVIERSKPVIGVHKITNKEVEFKSTREADRMLNISNSNISQCCLGNRKTAGGYYWRYKD